MKKILFCAALFLISLSQADDAWKGDEYAKNSESQKTSAEDFLQRAQFQNVTDILDVGCGDGKITAAMARSLPHGAIVGIDISPSMIQAAMSEFAHQMNLSFQVQDAAQLNFDQKFDLITSFTVMQWVLNQLDALRCFEKALKPGGKVLIQMPTGLPAAMQQAVEKTISSDRWKSYFVQFSPPWRFYQPGEYRLLLTEAHLTPTRLDVVTKHEHFPSRAVFHAFLKQWFPYLRPIPADQKDAFLTDLLDHYLELLPAEQGKVSFIVDRLEVEAVKSRAIIRETLQTANQNIFSQKSIHLELLKNCQQTIPTLAEWFYEEWLPYDPSLTKEKLIEGLGKRLNDDQLPFVIVALKDGLPIGMISLKDTGAPEFPTDGSPWIGSFYVLPSERNKGLGYELGKVVLTLAKRLGYEQVNFFTSHFQQVEKYLKKGATIVETRPFRGHTITIMKMPLTTSF